MRKFILLRWYAFSKATSCNFILILAILNVQVCTYNKSSTRINFDFKRHLRLIFLHILCMVIAGLPSTSDVIYLTNGYSLGVEFLIEIFDWHFSKVQSYFCCVMSIYAWQSIMKTATLHFTKKLHILWIK